MLRILSLVIVLGVTNANAGEVADKCEAAMNSTGAENVEEGCTCFESKANGPLGEEYMSLDLVDWDEEASQDLKDAGSSCFPTE